MKANKNNEKIVILCEYCQQKLRIPNKKDRTRIVCPTCKHEFDYPYEKSVTCPHCGELNPKHRILCKKCGKRMKLISKLSHIRSGVLFIFGGIMLIALDSGSGWHFGIPGIIAIPFVLSVLGVFIISLGISEIFGGKQ